MNNARKVANKVPFYFNKCDIKLQGILEALKIILEEYPPKAVIFSVSKSDPEKFMINQFHIKADYWTIKTKDIIKKCKNNGLQAEFPVILVYLETNKPT